MKIIPFITYLLTPSRTTLSMSHLLPNSYVIPKTCGFNDSWIAFRKNANYNLKKTTQIEYVVYLGHLHLLNILNRYRIT